MIVLWIFTSFGDIFMLQIIFQVGDLVGRFSFFNTITSMNYFKAVNFQIISEFRSCFNKAYHRSTQKCLIASDVQNVFIQRLHFMKDYENIFFRRFLWKFEWKFQHSFGSHGFEHHRHCVIMFGRFWWNKIADLMQTTCFCCSTTSDI